MVDRSVLAKKSASLLDHVRYLRAIDGLTVEVLRRDRRLRNDVLMELTQAIQDVTDLAGHACADEGLGAPASAAEAFELLAEAGRIDRDLAGRLQRAAGMRNLVVHEYTHIDPEHVVRAVEEGLDDLLAFVAALAG